MSSDLISKFQTQVVRVDVIFNGKFGNGSGLIVDENGTILTCDHVVYPKGEKPESIEIVASKTNHIHLN